MPTYEFRCPDGTIIERVFKISEVPNEIPAPDGSGMAVRIISGGAGLIFKGSGFYITDYGKDGKKDQRSSGAEGASSKSDTGGASTESKSESKSETKSGEKTSAPPPAPSTSSPSTPSKPSSSE